MKGVVSFTTLQQIIAGQARENVVAVQAPDCVIQDGADQGRVVARCALEEHTAQPRFHRDVLIAEPQHSHVAHHIHSIGCAAAVVVEGEPGGIPHNGVLGTTAGENRDIGTIATIDGVIATAAVQAVVATATEDRLVVAAAIDRVITGTTIKERTVGVIGIITDVIITVSARYRGRNVGTIYIGSAIMEHVIIRSAVDYPGTVDRVVAGAALGGVVAFNIP